MRRVVFIFFLFGLILQSCSQGDGYATPRPRMYPKVEFPDRKYEKVTLADCGFSFDIPISAELINKSNFFEEEIEKSCWFNIHYPLWDATVHYTYYPIDGTNNYAGLVNETFKMAYEHTGMATGINEIPLTVDGRNMGFAFDLSGPVASPYQFFISDSTAHFLRGSLYFNTRPNPDSLAPMIDYIQEDLDTFINSFQWP